MKDLPGSSAANTDSDHFARVVDIFRPIFDEIRVDAAKRDRERILPYAQVDRLRAARFGALRVPVELGGYGLTIGQALLLMQNLATADSNIPQALRAHFGLVERLLAIRDEPQARHWLLEIGSGLIAGNAFTERGAAKAGSFATALERQDDGWRLNGEKFYSTGSLFSDIIEVGATGPDGSILSAIVPNQTEGVELLDDWDGFGQKLTASGTSRFKDVVLQDIHVLPNRRNVHYLTALYQLVHLTTLAGIAHAASQDLVAQLQKRSRVFSHGNGNSAAQDPQLLQIAGKVAAQAEAATALVQYAARSLDEAAVYGAANAEALAQRAEIASAQAQVVVIPLVLDATTILFDALGASASASALGLDRYWRNARVISSHNPRSYKERIIGDYLVNGTYTDPFWIAGAS